MSCERDVGEAFRSREGMSRIENLELISQCQGQLTEKVYETHLEVGLEVGDEETECRWL